MDAPKPKNPIPKKHIPTGFYSTIPFFQLGILVLLFHILRTRVFVTFFAPLTLPRIGSWGATLFIRSENISTKKSPSENIWYRWTFFSVHLDVSQDSLDIVVWRFTMTKPIKPGWEEINVPLSIPSTTLAPLFYHCTLPTRNGLVLRVMGGSVCVRREYTSTDHKKPDIPMQNCLGLGCLKAWLSFEMDGEDNIYKNEVWKQKKRLNRRLKWTDFFSEKPHNSC